MENYYDLLEVSKTASNEVISKVFKHHIKKNHPDLYSGNEKTQAELKTQKLNEAYEILSNPDKRKLYDQELEEYENSNNYNKDIEIENLKNTLSNYNRFIYEYFYENADNVFDVINSYDNFDENYDKQEIDSFSNNKIKNNSSLQFKSKLKDFFFTILAYIIPVIIFLIAISLALKTNILALFFK